MELSARTPAGADLVALAEGLAEDLASRAAAHDRDGTYPHESIRSLRDAGYLVAPVPAELGGLGVSSVHDLVVASGRLARGDASVAIGVNMHLIAVMALARRMRVAVAARRRRGARRPSPSRCGPSSASGASSRPRRASRART